MKKRETCGGTLGVNSRNNCLRLKRNLLKMSADIPAEVEEDFLMKCWVELQEVHRKKFLNEFVMQFLKMLELEKFFG